MLKISFLTIAALLAVSCAKKAQDIVSDGLNARYADAIKELSQARTEKDRFYSLNYAEKEAFNMGLKEHARLFAQEHARLLPKYKGDWNYGNAFQDVNIVMGRLALAEGRMEDARRYLLKAGDTPGSPQLKSFGPNMTLARDLLLHGEREVVLEYFGKCSRFWKMDRGALERWTAQVRAGKIPDFGANLIF